MYENASKIASRTVSKNRLYHQRPTHDSDKNHSPVEGFVSARCLLDQKVRQKKEIYIAGLSFRLAEILLESKHCCRG